MWQVPNGLLVQVTTTGDDHRWSYGDHWAIVAFESASKTGLELCDVSHELFMTHSVGILKFPITRIRTGATVV